MRITRWTAPALALLAFTACRNDGLGPDDAFNADDAAEIALDTDAMTGDIVFAQMLFGGFGLQGDVAINSDTRTFARSHDCPAGGNIQLNGSIERTVSGPGSFEFSVAANGAWNNCAHTRREITRTVNGTFSFESHRKLVNGQPEGPQTASKKGHFTWTTSNGKSGECEFDITSTRLPDQGKRTVQGTVCGRTIDRTVSWRRSDG
jgi:hypothetical protein